VALHHHVENMLRTGCYFVVAPAALTRVDARTLVKTPFLTNAFAPLLLFTFLAIYMLSQLYLLLRLFRTWGRLLQRYTNRSTGGRKWLL